MPGAVEQIWAIQPTHTNMQILAGSRGESAEATSRSGSSATTEKTKEASVQEGTMSWLFHSASTSEPFTDEE